MPGAISVRTEKDRRRYLQQRAQRNGTARQDMLPVLVLTELDKQDADLCSEFVRKVLYWARRRRKAEGRSRASRTAAECKHWLAEFESRR